MVGAVVDKGYSQYRSHENVDLVTNTSTTTTTTTTLMTSGTLFTNAMNSSTTMSTPSTDADTIKLGFAMAVTFLVGCIQVQSSKNFKNLFILSLSNSLTNENGYKSQHDTFLKNYSEVSNIRSCVLNNQNSVVCNFSLYAINRVGINKRCG